MSNKTNKKRNQTNTTAATKTTTKFISNVLIITKGINYKG